jgi:SNF2 family DNA or RNA helicase
VLTVDLHPYQEEAVDRAVERGSLLIAYTMGLGKTLVALATIEELIAAGEVRQSLLVVPAGLKWQWAQSIARFTDVAARRVQLRKGVYIWVPEESVCVVVDGTPAKRKAAYQQAIDHRPEFTIVSYEQVRNDFRMVRRLKPDCIVLDEASAIKGFTAKRTKLTKQLDAPFRFALTGTPVENRPEELYSILQWVDPKVLGRFDLFDRSFIVRNKWGGVVRYKNLQVLHKKARPAMVRKTRTDPDVAKYLPQVQESVKQVTLHPKLRGLYQRISDDLSTALADANMTGSFDLTQYYSGTLQSQLGSAAGDIMARTSALLMLCDDPRLLQRSAEKYLKGDGQGSAYAAGLLESGRLVDAPSNKLDEIVADVTDILDGESDSKVILFSFYKDVVQELSDRLGSESNRAVVYTGDMNVKQKAAAQTRFQTDPEVRLFISSDAGGYGVDLPQANYLINVDLAWSAGKMDQRNGRHVRVGSAHKRVYILNYLIEGSIEERTYQMLAMKRQVASATLDGVGADSKGVIENSVGSLASYLADTPP